MISLKEKIIICKQNNLAWGARKIAAELGCAYSTVHYHLNEKCKTAKNNRQIKRRLENPILKKYEVFVYRKLRKKKSNFGRLYNDNQYLESRFTFQELLKKIEKNPYCYLTGKFIDIQNTESYNFDHIIPIVQGGDNSLNNLGLTTAEANAAKSGKTPEQF